MASTGIQEVDFSKIKSQDLFKLDYVIDSDFVLVEVLKEFPKTSSVKFMLNCIIFCNKGQVDIEMNGRIYELKANEVFFVLSGNISTGWNFSKDAECRLICISDKMVRSTLGSNIDLWNRFFYVHGMRKLQLQGWFEKYYSFIRAKSEEPETPRKNQILAALIQAAMLDFCDHLNEDIDLELPEVEASQGSILFQRFLDLLEKTNPKRQTVEYYSSKLCVSPKYLSMVCKNLSTKTASEWIHSYVDADIRLHLLRLDISIKQVAEMLGFENLSFFGKYVSSRFGCSPRAFRLKRFNSAPDSFSNDKS